MSHIRRLLFNWFGVFLGLFIVTFGAYIAIAEPAWVVDPLRGAASDVLGGMGVAIVLPILWSDLGWLAPVTRVPATSWLSGVT